MFELGNSFSWAITRQKRRPSHLTTRILNLYTEALIGFCLQYHAECSQQCTALSRPLRKAPAMGTAGRMYVPRTGEGEHSPTAQAQLSVQPLVTFSWWPLPTPCPLGPPLPIPHAPPFSMHWRIQQEVSSGGLVHSVALWLPWNRCHSKCRGTCIKK